MLRRRATANINWWWPLLGLLLLMALVAIAPDDVPMWADEGVSAWVVYDGQSLLSGDTGLRAQAAAVLDSQRTTFERSQSVLGQLPAYYLLLDAWVLLFGDALVMLRLFSVLWALIAVASAYALLQFAALPGWGWVLFWLVAAPLVLWLGAYNATPVTLAIALALLSSALFWRWRKRRTAFYLLAYVFFITGLLLTHLMGILIFVLHLVSAAPPSTVRRQWLVVVGSAMLIVLIVVRSSPHMPLLPPLERPLWHTTIADVAALRPTIEPAMQLIPATSPAAYYARQLGLTDGISVDIAWREFDTDELDRVISAFAGVPRVWFFADSQTADAAYILDALQQSHPIIGYQITLDNIAFYRLDRASDHAPQGGS